MTPEQLLDVWHTLVKQYSHHCRADAEDIASGAILAYLSAPGRITHPLHYLNKAARFHSITLHRNALRTPLLPTWEVPTDPPQLIRALTREIISQAPNVLIRQGLGLPRKQSRGTLTYQRRKLWKYVQSAEDEDGNGNSPPRSSTKTQGSRNSSVKSAGGRGISPGFSVAGVSPAR